MITYSFLAIGSQGVPAALSYSQEGKGKESPGRHFAGLLGCMEKVSYKIIVFFFLPSQNYFQIIVATSCVLARP